MVRKIIKIDEERCNGCGLCAEACHEGAIGMVEGRARLLRDDYCDGFGDCLPMCPTGAISFEEREADAYNEAEVKKNMAQKRPLPCGCLGTNAHTITRETARTIATGPDKTTAVPTDTESQLVAWPVQIRLAPVNAPCFNGAHLLVAADCAAYAHAWFHEDFMANRVTIIGCPKLDDVDYSEKLTEILRRNSIKSVTVVRMEVPCCGGIENAVIKALQNSGKMIPWQVVKISTDGRVLED